MGLKEQINEDMKQYMRDKNTFALEAIRMLKSDIKNAEIETKEEFQDADIQKLIQSTIKKNKDAAEIYKQADRVDLMEKEMKYCDALSKYLPTQLSPDELDNKVKEIVAGLGAGANFGEIMKAVMAEVGSAADGKAVSAAVKKITG